MPQLFPQKIVGAYLRQEVAPIRVVSSPPSDVTSAWVYLQLISDPQQPNAPFDWMHECYFQMDCYAGATGGWPEADQLRADVREAWLAMPRGSYSGGVVTHTRIENGGKMEPQAGPPFEPARPRFIVTATAWIHP